MNIKAKLMLYVSVVLFMCGIVFPVHGGENEQDTSIRIAYPTATLINGQIGQIMLNTNILKKNNLKAEVFGFQYGAPMMEALVSNKVDVSFTSEVPATLTIAKGHKATIIATLGYLGRGAIMVLADSAVKKISDLEGKKVAVPFGSSPHRNLLVMLKRAGLTPGENVEVLNIGRDEVAPVLLKGGVDAIMIWDPAVEQYKEKNGFRIIESESFYSVVIMNNDFILNNYEAAIDFINALKEAVFFLATNKEMVNSWFGEVSRLDYRIIDTCSNFNINYRNVKNISDVDISLNSDFLKMIEESAEFTANQNLIPALDISKAINPQIEKKAAAKIKNEDYNPSDIIVTK